MKRIIIEVEKDSDALLITQLLIDKAVRFSFESIGEPVPPPRHRTVKNPKGVKALELAKAAGLVAFSPKQLEPFCIQAGMERTSASSTASMAFKAGTLKRVQNGRGFIYDWS